MKVCTQCGTVNEDKSKYCSECGFTLGSDCYSNDYPLFNLQVLSFLLPWIGWILYGIYAHDKPRAARSYLNYSLLAFLVSIILFVLAVSCTAILVD